MKENGVVVLSWKCLSCRDFLEERVFEVGKPAPRCPECSEHKVQGVPLTGLSPDTSVSDGESQKGARE
jgi:hypothetical protein